MHGYMYMGWGRHGIGAKDGKNIRFRVTSYALCCMPLRVEQGQNPAAFAPASGGPMLCAAIGVSARPQALG
jgi:hypothetical protein